MTEPEEYDVVVLGSGEAGNAQLAMAAALPYTLLRDMVLTHPTMAEGLVALFSAVPIRK